MSVFTKLTTHVPDDTLIDVNVRKLLYQHKDYLNGLASTTDMPVSVGDARPYERNLFGYLVYMKIPPRLHWPIMMLSNLTSPAEFTSSIGYLRRPNLSEIDAVLTTAGL